jgi:hypothetical protein
MKMRKIILAVMLLCVLPFVHAGSNDYVESVYSCGNDVGLKMKNAGWVVIQQASVGERRLESMLSIALTLVATQNPTGYFNEQTAINWCGISDVKPITVLAIIKA